MIDCPSKVDVVIVGAGPAGLAAAITLADGGIVVGVFDEQPAPGGQIYRNIEQLSVLHPERLSALGPDYAEGLPLVRQFRASAAYYVSRATVWQITPEREIWFSRDGASYIVRARHVLLATGAMERPVPLPGWTLPGVMTAGALQVLLKTGSSLPGHTPVFIGSGPLLLQLISQCISAGVPPAAVVDTTPIANWFAAAARLPHAFSGHGIAYLRRGLRLRRALRASGIDHFGPGDNVHILGDDFVRAVAFRVGKRSLQIESDLVALHDGVIPSQQIPRALGCRFEWNEAQVSHAPTVDPWGATSVSSVHVAGDAAGIGGAKAAEQRGRIAATAILCALGVISQAERDRICRRDRAELAAHLAVRPLLDALYRPSISQAKLTDETVVCRCEAVDAGTLRELVAYGCAGPNEAKSLSRCGMGPCQGRMCGPTVAALFAGSASAPASNMEYFRIRPPYKPVSMRELAAMKQGGAEP